jgi:hypothetical protein
VKCSTCSTDNPDVAHFCHRCGSALRAGSGRAGAFAVQTSEGVNQFALISTIMPHTNRRTADTYRWALIASAVLIVGATVLGLLPIAIAGAAFLVPLVYLVYIDDMNVWEEAPGKVVAAVFVVTGLLSVLVTLFFYQWVFQEQWTELLFSASRGGIGAMPIGGLMIFVVLLPVVAEAVKNLAAIVLARMPQFDDMIDALTFGVASGTAYAAAETLVLFAPVFTADAFRTTTGLATWTAVVINLMVVKSLIYGTATGISVASFSGKGEGYDGFTGRFARGFAFAAGANIVYWLGVRLAANLPWGQAMGLLWGFIVLAVLVIRVRVVMQSALLEAAVEDAATSGAKRSTEVEGYCPECEHPLMPGSQFCIICGTSVRSTSAQNRRHLGVGRSGGAS